MTDEDKPKKAKMPMLQLIPTVIGAVLGMQFAEDRLSVMLGLSESSVSGAALDGGLGALAGAAIGSLIGLGLVRVFGKSDAGAAADGE